MKKWLIVLATACALAGCNSLPDKATDEGSVTRTVKKADGSTETVSNKSDYANYLDKVGEAKSFKMSCPATGCIIGSLEVPLNAGGDVKLAPPPGPPKSMGVAFVEGVFDFGKAVLGAGVSMAPYGALGYVVKALGRPSNTSTMVTNTSDSSNRSTTTATTTSTDSSNRSTNTDNSNHSVNNSNNHNCQTGSPTGTTTQSGSSGPATC